MTTPEAENSVASTVAVTRCTSYQSDKIAEAIHRQFSLLDERVNSRFISKGDNVLLKPNLIVPRPSDQAVQTDPAVILAVAKTVKDLGGRPFVGDSVAWGDIRMCIKFLELEEALKKLGVPVKPLNRPERHKIAGSSIGISKVALEADKIINLPKFKTHQQLGTTFAVKNMFGCVSGKEKPFWHFAKGKSRDDFCEMLIGIYKLLGPRLTIIDGVVAMEGNGPINGQAKPLGFLIGGIDPIACEMICCELVSLNPDDLPMIQTARRIGFGCSDLSRINVLGDNYKEFVCKDFIPAIQTPLKFSFLQICKSIVKQILLLVKTAFGGKKR